MSSCLLKIATLPVKTLVALMKISAGLAQMASNAARHRVAPLEVPVMNHALVIEAPHGREVACSAPGSVRRPVDAQIRAASIEPASRTMPGFSNSGNCGGSTAGGE